MQRSWVQLWIESKLAEDVFLEWREFSQLLEADGGLAFAGAAGVLAACGQVSQERAQAVDVSTVRGLFGAFFPVAAEMPFVDGPQHTSSKWGTRAVGFTYPGESGEWVADTTISAFSAWTVTSMKERQTRTVGTSNCEAMRRKIRHAMRYLLTVLASLRRADPKQPGVRSRGQLPRSVPSDKRH